MPTPTTYTYGIAADTANDAVNNDDLTTEIEAAAIVPVLLRVDTAGDVLDLGFDDVLSGAEQTTLTAVVLAHQGVAATSHVAHAAATVRIADLLITEDATWQDLGAAILLASDFGQVDQMHVHLRLETKSVHGGGTPQLRIVDDDGSTVTQLHPTPWFTIVDDASFVCAAFQATDTPPIDDTVPHRIRLEGRLNGATSASIRRAHITLVELQ